MKKIEDEIEDEVERVAFGRQYFFSFKGRVRKRKRLVKTKMGWKR